MKHLTNFRWIGDGTFLIAIDRDLNVAKLTELAMVKAETYSAELVGRMLSSVFNGLVDLREEYETYYREEYRSLEQFIAHRHDVKEKFAIQFSKLAEQKMLLVGRGNVGCGGDNILGQWIDDPDGDKMLRKLIGCGSSTSDDDDDDEENHED